MSFVIPNRYEEEINKRTAAENDFVLLKKVKLWAAQVCVTRTKHLQAQEQALIKLVSL